MGLFSRQALTEDEGVILKLDHRGHGVEARYHRAKPEALSNAAKVFADHQARHYTMFDISNGDGIKMDAFDPQAREILAVPRMQAG